MSEGYGYFCDGLTAAERDSILDDMQAMLYVINESTNEIEFGRWPAQTVAAAGRLFGPQSEVRWWPEEDGYSMLIISETEQKLDGDRWQSLSFEVDEQSKIYLWGNHWHSLQGATDELPNEWVQAQINRPLQYPVEGNGKRPQVVADVRHYRRDGIILLSRLCDVRAVREARADA